MSTDDEADLSPSLSAKYESPAKAKREALQQKLQKEGLHTATDSSALHCSDGKPSSTQLSYRGT